MHRLFPLIIGLALLLPGITSRVWAAAMLDAPLRHTLSAAVDSAPIPVIVTLENQDLPSRFSHLPAGRQRHNALLKAMRQQSAESRRELRLFLQDAGIRKVKPLRTINGLAFLAPPELLTALAARPEVAEIRLDAAITAPPAPVPSAVADSQWNIGAVGAPLLWDLGLTGSGVVLASLDSGVDPMHPDLAGRYRGGPGAWFDPNDEHPTPYDYNGHGTAVMAIMVGGSADGTAIGMAPAAQWIAAKIFNDDGVGTYSAIHQAFAWALDPDGDDDGIDAPRVVNNSWSLGSPNQCLPEFQPDIALLRAAGITVVFSAGNVEVMPANPTSSTSPANYPESLAVGATNQAGGIATFSARGPSSCPGGDQLFPQVVAPGINIKSADRTLSGSNPYPYLIADGTSFAAPHVSGLLALLLGQNGLPATTLPLLEETLEKAADDLGPLGPDNTFGHGLINSLAAYRRLRGEPHLAVHDPRPPEHDRRFDFGTLPVGATLSRTLTLRNSGGGFLVFAGHDWSGLDPALTVTDDLCSSQSLAGDQTCQLTVSFAPTATTTYAVTLNLITNDPDFNPVALSLSGSGINAPIPPTLQVEPAGRTVDFGAVPPGGESQRTLTLRNGGEEVLIVDPIDFSALAAPFALINDNCGNSSLGANETCTLLFSFRPTDRQNYQTQLTITANDPENSPLTVLLSGNGNHPPSPANPVAPANGATGLATSLTLRWLPGTDPDGDKLSEVVVLAPPAPAGAGLLTAGPGTMGAGAIILFLAGSLLFYRRPTSLPAPLLVVMSVGLIFLAACGGGGAAPTSVTYGTYTPAPLAANTTYNWKVVTTDSRGASTESATWQFTTR